MNKGITSNSLLNFTDLEAAKKYFSDDKFATQTMGAYIDQVSENESICALKITKEHLNAMNNLMGGAIMSLADFSFAVASNGHGNTVSVSSTTEFIDSFKGSLLYAHAYPIKIGKTLIFYRIDVYDDLDTKVATVSSIGKRL